MDIEKQSDSNDDNEIEKVYNFDRVLQLTTWARVVSWVLIGTGVLMIGLVLFIIGTQLIQAGMPDAFNLVSLVVLFGVALLPIFLGLILQFFSEGIFLLVDIEQNTSGKANS
ncbi:MAG: hypothetical protein KJZ72_04235 [Anaerolineales bacterium]|nr:hypothetical protein [Anaerolineales bacterium]